MDPFLSILPPSEPWTEWAVNHPDQIPDVEALPACADLPDPLVWMEDGRERLVTTAAEWRQRREQILELFHHFVIGTVPPPPGNVRAMVLETRDEQGATVQRIRLEFGPEHSAVLPAELFIPTGEGPFPVFLTQSTHRAWGQIALSRGYMVCVYAGSDDDDASGGFAEAYPEYDWSKLTRRSWAASRCIDYLVTLPQVDAARVALTGHSRNGKQSLIAAAMDERISVVISSSSGVGGAMPYRCFGEEHYGEGPEALTRVFPDWYHPRLRCFAGREDHLPVDNHELIALIAPRACLIATALNDVVEGSWGIERAYRAAQQVYRLLGAEDRLRVHWRYGTHETRAEEIEAYLDWCDNAYGRRQLSFPERFIHPYTFAEWQQTTGEALDPAAFPPHQTGVLAEPGGAPVQTAEQWRARREQIRQRIRWTLGEAPPAVTNVVNSYGAEYPHVASRLNRMDVPGDVEKYSFAFGQYVAADVYLPIGARESGRRLPVILWLHPYSYSTGYVSSYARGPRPYHTLAQEGFAVFCFDQAGFGNRQGEGGELYARYPRWSLLGKMAHDARAALDAVAQLPYADGERVYVLGYNLGGLVGLHAAALDDRIAGIAAVCGVTPWRHEAQERTTGGIARFYDWHGLLPRLGLFQGQRDRIPYDFEELLALAAPRPALVVSPRWDRHASLAAVTDTVSEARRAYALLGVPERLEQQVPNLYNSMGPEMQSLVFPWLKRTAGLNEGGE